MASRIIIARFLNKEKASHTVLRGGIAQQCVRAYHHVVMANAATSAAAPEPPLLRFMPERLPSSLRDSKDFSTMPNQNQAESPQKAKKSPHSKLLRVCSERNSNSHFAAIEADMLRLNWKEAMDTLLEDWTQKKRWGDFIELESNVRTYVNKNFLDLKYYESECVKEWEGSDELKKSMSLSDHLRFHHFPYERIINSTVHHAISGKVFNTLKMKEMGGSSGNKNNIAMAEVHERILILSNAGKLLEAMISINVNPEEETNMNDGWTGRHTACSNCFRSIISGWFLLNRRLRDANHNMLSDSTAADVIDATTKLDILPEEEAYSWADKWIDFCASSHGVGGHEEGQSGILDSDKPLLTGVARVLSMSESGERQMQCARLNQRLDMLFPEDE